MQKVTINHYLDQDDSPGYFVIPSRIAFDSSLTLCERYLLGYLRMRTSFGEVVFETPAQISSFLSLRESHVKRAIKRLIAKDLIKVEIYETNFGKKVGYVAHLGGYPRV